MADPLGALGEQLASQYLQSKDYSILFRNFRSRAGEIDIVCQKDKTVIFVEVKTRVSIYKGMPYESVTALKLHHLKKAIYFFLKEHPHKDSKFRLDVVSIMLDNNRQIQDLKHFENVELPGI